MQRQAIGSRRSGTRVWRSPGDVPERLVERRVRAEREHDRHERSRVRGRVASPRSRFHQSATPDERGDRQQPAEKTKLSNPWRACRAKKSQRSAE